MKTFHVSLTIALVGTGVVAVVPGCGSGNDGNDLFGAAAANAGGAAGTGGSANVSGSNNHAGASGASSGSAGAVGTGGSAGKGAAGHAGSTGAQGGHPAGGSGGKGGAGGGGHAGVGGTQSSAGNNNNGGNNSAGNNAAGNGDAGTSGGVGGSSAGTSSAGGMSAQGGNPAGTGGSGTAGNTVCGDDDTACSSAATSAGLCQSGDCQPCDDPDDDDDCSAAYGNGSGYICAGGVCVVGTCHTDDDCPSKQSCGANHQCAACDPLSGTTYFVDPINGDDKAGTGSGTLGGAASPGCAFRTISAAIKAIGNGGSTKLTISVAGPSTLDGGENYPLTIPAQTVVTATGGVVTVNLDDGDVAFQLKQAGAAIDGGTGFLVDGGGKGSNGVQVDTGSTDGTFLRAIAIQATTAEGINLANQGKLTLYGGVIVRQCGTMDDVASGIVAQGKSLLTIAPKAGEAPVLIDGNTADGVDILENAALSLTGTADGNGALTGTVLFSKNVGPGLSFIPGNGTIPASVVTGLVSVSSTTGSGILINAGSTVKVRNSVLIDNAKDGIHVAGTDNSSAIGGIDLGVTKGLTPDFGNNILQQTAAQGHVNVQVGLCLDIPTTQNPTQAQTLNAEGNIFGANKNCQNFGPNLATDHNCAGGDDVGVIQGNGVNFNKVDFGHCGG